MELNEKFLSNMKSLLKNDYENYILSLKKPAKHGFTIRKKGDFEFKYKLFDGLDAGLILEDRKLGNTLAHHLGLIYLQEPSSMLPAVCLEVKEGERVLDLCSAPGGKASQILSKNTSGVVVLNEVVRSRANVLMSNIERQGFKNAIITSLTPERLSEFLPNYFDKILVDAPCSGEGMFRKDEKTILEWNEGLAAFNHQRQMKILQSADKMLKKGGTLVYSTCTFNLEEDELTAEEFAKEFDYGIVEVPEVVKPYSRAGFEVNGNIMTTKCRRCFPQDDFGEGQFFAKLKKNGEENPAFCEKLNKNRFNLSKKELEIAKNLTKECLNDENFAFYKVGNNIYCYPFEVPNVENVVMLGVCVGTIEMGRLVPHHQFFKCYGDRFINRLVLSKNDERVKDYVLGREIDCPYNGYVAVIVDGVCLGGGKGSGGRLKNYYPKGLRALLN